MREFYASENGDVWYLALTRGGGPQVVHKANLPSGGAQTEWEVDTFLTTHRRHTPEHQGLLRLIAGLVDAPGPAEDADLNAGAAPS